MNISVDKVYKYPTHYRLTDYTPGDCPALETAFSAYVKPPYPNGPVHFDPIGLVYDRQRKELRIPGGAPEGYISKLTERVINIIHQCDDFDTISVRMTKYPRNDLQRDMVQFLIGGGKFCDTKNFQQLSCNAETGEGKTYGAISAMTYMRCKMAIIVNRKDIRESWAKEIATFTDIDKTRILSITPEVARRILKGKINVSKYYVFIMLHNTLRSIASKSGWDTITKLFQMFRVGLKVYDEANMEFANSVYIDAYTNTYKTLYLTATMERASEYEDKVFQRAFSAVPKFNQYDLGYTESKRHIHMIALIYDSKPTSIEIEDCKVKGLGYFDPKKHSEYQINRDPLFFEILHGLIDKFTVKNQMRTVVFVAKINPCDVVKTDLENTYPDKKVGAYNSSIPDKEKERVRDECDIITSINKSLGFASTIPNLRCVINCQAFSFDGIGDQMSGRLRRLATGEECWYIELIDRGFKTIYNQWKKRKKHYEKIFKEIIELKY